MKCLVTGINGVVGKNISNLLSEKYGFDIWGCGRTNKNDSKYFTLDLSDRVAVLDLFSKNNFDCVIHCAANISNEDPFEVYGNNIVSTLNIVEAVLTYNVKKIFNISSIPIIGEILQLPITEEHPNNPTTAYHFSKLQSEQIVEYYCKDKIDFLNIRIPSPVGRDMPLRSVFPIFVEKIKKNKNITLIGDSQRRQNFLDLRDLANFIYKASLVNGISGLFNVAAKKTYSNLELAEAIILKLGSNSKIINNMTDSNLSNQNWDISTNKAKKYFGYISEYDLEDTLEWVL
jgi:UDP-glucose 4-epimerase